MTWIQLIDKHADGLGALLLIAILGLCITICIVADAIGRRFGR